MKTLRQAAEQALDALEKCDYALAEELAAWDINPPLHHVLDASNACGSAVTALQEALAQREWVGLTEDDIEEAINANCGTGLWSMAKDIEDKLKEKNT